MLAITKEKSVLFKKYSEPAVLKLFDLMISKKLKDIISMLMRIRGK